jgi:hypothetical protein
MSAPTERLYSLLPAVYRLRDAERGSPLRALLAVMETELDTIDANITHLYESLFVETADEWVLPYIGDLVGNRLLVETAHSRRADIAKTIYYRRRKGTLPMLEELARDVTGWGAHAVEFMELLGWNQNLNHLRYELAPNPGLEHPSAFAPPDPDIAPGEDPPGPPHVNPTAVDRVGTLNLRSSDVLDRLDGPWDRTAHTVDVRRARPGAYLANLKAPARAQEGWYGTRKIGFFLWRLGSYPLEPLPARRAAAPNQHGWHFSPLGAPVPLFADPRVERDPARLAREIHVPAPIRRLAFREDIERYRARFLPLPLEQRPVASEWYGPGRSLNVVADGASVPPASVFCKDLEDWARPPADEDQNDLRVGIDVRRGRISFAEGHEPEEVQVTFAYGFSADLGGGPYDRRASLADPAAAEWSITVRKETAIDTLQEALAAWVAAGHPAGIIEIADSEVYGGTLAIDLPAGSSLVIQAAQGRWPSLRLPFGALDVHLLEGSGRLRLDGLFIEGVIELDGNVTLEIAHCTLVPGRALDEGGEPRSPGTASLIVAGNDVQTPEVTITASICGAIRLPDTARALTIRDSIVQAHPVDDEPRPAIAADDTGDEPGPPTTLERVTVFGTVHVRELTLASEVIFTAPVTAQRRQVGCVRFSYVADGSETPRRFQCQPDLALADITEPDQQERIRRRLVPTFTSERYGDPGYAQLRLSCALEIRTGAENGSEMGAFSMLMQPQREGNLRTRLEEYLPFGLEAALIYVT